MTDKQKRDYIIGILTAAMMPEELEAELIGFVNAKCPEASVINNFAAGAEFMRRAAVGKVLELEEGCLGIQKAAFVVTRNAIEQIEIAGAGR